MGYGSATSSAFAGAMQGRPSFRFPRGFRWGTATSSYQIEGATSEDGRGESIWDRFSSRPGAIADGSDGRRACDHYRRWQEDLALLNDLGVDSYRFSVAWPRVVPEGVGRVNAAGLDFYERLVDGLLAADIEPFVTLYHWDLPQALEDRGGWPERTLVDAYTEYVRHVADRLGDRVTHWITHNEPWCAALLGYLEGVHAPGRTDGAAALAAAHHILVSHGQAVAVLRERVPGAQVGLSNLNVTVYPASPSDEDAAEARRLDGTFNRWFLDPLYGRGYPADTLEHYAREGWVDAVSPAWLQAGDLETIAAETDFLGVNLYTRAVARCPSTPEADNLPRTIPEPSPEALTDMGWEVHPAALTDLLVRLQSDYRPRRVFITENGAAYSDCPDAFGRIDDDRRIAYLGEHLQACIQAIERGVPLQGYFLWSLLDNFEWAFGYEKRFGITWVDFDSGRRLLKQSGHWYRDVVGSNR